MVKLDEIIYKQDEKWRVNWDKISEIPEFTAMKTCEQNPKWHREGSVWNHTVNVVNIMLDQINNGSEFAGFTTPYQSLIAAALFHDIGKPVTTFSDKNGISHHYGHEFSGEKITRQLLWDEGYKIREPICALVRCHMEPLNVFKSKNINEKIVYLCRYMWEAETNIQALLLLKYCDIMGSDQEDVCSKEIDLARIKYLKFTCRNYHIFNQLPLSREDAEKSVISSMSPKQKIYIMMGLPGAGKDTFISKLMNGNIEDYRYDISSIIMYHNLNEKFSPDNTDIISRDVIREELNLVKPGEKKVCTQEEENQISKRFDYLVLTSLYNKRDIIINNMNIRKSYRDNLIKLFEHYNVEINFIYIEADNLDTNISRRAGQIEAGCFTNMVKVFDWPDVTEYNGEFYKFKSIVKNETGRI